MWMGERRRAIRPAFRGLQGTFNAVGEFGIWKNHWPLTVPRGPYRRHYISWSKRASCTFTCHMSSPEMVLQSPKCGPVKLFLLLTVPCFLLCGFFVCLFLQKSISFQQGKEQSMMISNVLNCLLDMHHSGEKQDVASKNLFKICILFWNKI